MLASDSSGAGPPVNSAALRLAHVPGLVVEVLDGDPAERPEGQAVADDEVRSLVVDVDLERPRVAGDEHRLADRLEVVADGVDVEALVAARPQQEHRLVAEALVGVGDERAGLGARARRPGRARAGDPDRGLAGEVQERALEQPVQALPAGVDDAGLAQDGQQARRPGDRLLGRLEGRGQDDLDVVVALGGRDRRGGRLADDREDRALDRLGDGAVGRLGALAQGVGQVEAVEPALARRAPRPCPGRSGW